MVFVNPYSDLRFGGPFSRGGVFRLKKIHIVDMGGFGHLMDFCNFWTRELHLNSSYGLGILRQPFRTMSCRKFGS